jgi:hypothetical protein
MKNTNYYFAHDFDAASDPKTTYMLSDYGGLGYGLYWRIIELLHKEANHILPRKPFLYIGLAKQLMTKEENVTAFIDDCIKKYELFSENEDGFFSERVLTNFKEMANKKQQISNIRKAAGKTGGIKSGEARKNEE